MAKLKGLGKVLANLNKEVKKIEGRSLKGLIRGGILIRRDMEETAPIIPVDLGNLRASWFVVTSTGGVPTGRGREFKGEKASELISGHSKAISENKSLAKQSGMPGIVMGFSANYATAVHENVGANFRQPTKGKRAKAGGAGPKFLEASLKRNTKKVLQVIGEEARIK